MPGVAYAMRRGSGRCDGCEACHVHGGRRFRSRRRCLRLSEPSSLRPLKRVPVGFRSRAIHLMLPHSLTTALPLTPLLPPAVTLLFTSSSRPDVNRLFHKQTTYFASAE